METEITKQRERVDLHLHFRGSNSDRKTIEEARKVGVVALAGGLRGGAILPNYQDLATYGERLGVQVIPETECNIDGTDLIGIGFYYNHPEMEKWESIRQKWNAQATEKQMLILENKGFNFKNLNEENKKALAKVLVGQEAARAWRLSVIAATSETNHQALENFIKENGERWEKAYAAASRIYKNEAEKQAKAIWLILFAPKTDGFIRALPPDVDKHKFIETIHKAGGLVLYSPEGKYKPETWDEIKNLGIDGIMGWHGGRLELSKSIIKQVLRDGKLVLGGSDYDPEKQHWAIGVGDGAMFISKRHLPQFWNFINASRLTHMTQTQPSRSMFALAA